MRVVAEEIAADPKLKRCSTSRFCAILSKSKEDALAVHEVFRLAQLDNAPRVDADDEITVAYGLYAMAIASSSALRNPSKL